MSGILHSYGKENSKSANVVDIVDVPKGSGVVDVPKGLMLRCPIPAQESVWKPQVVFSLGQTLWAPLP